MQQVSKVWPERGVPRAGTIADQAKFDDAQATSDCCNAVPVAALVLRVFRGCITVSYGSKFATVPGAWIEVRIPLADLTPTVRGMTLDGPPLDKSTIREIGLLIGDKREGAFWLEVDWIGAE